MQGKYCLAYLIIQIHDKSFVFLFSKEFMLEFQWKMIHLLFRLPLPPTGYLCSHYSINGEQATAKEVNLFPPSTNSLGEETTKVILYLKKNRNNLSFSNAFVNESSIYYAGGFIQDSKSQHSSSLKLNSHSTTWITFLQEVTPLREPLANEAWYALVNRRLGFVRWHQLFENFVPRNKLHYIFFFSFNNSSDNNSTKELDRM